MPRARRSSAPPPLTGATLVAGDVVGGWYEVERELGRGGTATVYLARDRRHGRPVALKMLHRELVRSIGSARFLQEVAVMAGLQHAHLVTILDSGEWHETPFYVMSYLDGEGLRARLAREHQFPVDDVVQLGREAADALHYVHECGVVHRDVKPENILVAHGHAFVADFGIAYAIARASADRLTSSQTVVGTPMYMSPEQAAGTRDLDGRSDQYALACVLYELLAGVPPFPGVTTEAILGQRLARPPVPVTAHRPNIPPPVAAAIGRALSVSPADRFRTMHDFAAALSGEHATPATGAAAGAAAAPRPRRRLVVAAGALVVFALGGAELFRATRGPAVRAADDPRRIAVLPFETGGADRTLGDLARGLRDALSYELGSARALTVLAGAGAACDTPSARCDSALAGLHVGSVVRGSVQRSGERLQVTVHLVDRASGVALASDVYERPAGDLLPLQRELALRISAALRRRLGRAARLTDVDAGTSSDAARSLVARADRLRDDALAMADRPAREDVRAALASLAAADSLLALARRADPAWMRPLLERGWMANDVARLLPDSLRPAPLRRGLTFADSVLRADTANARALELRGTLRWAIVTLLDPATSDSAAVRLAERDLRRALDRDSTLASAWGTLSYVHAVQGALAEAVLDGRRALAQDAYLDDARELNYQLFFSELMLGDYAAARESCARARQGFPEDWRFVLCELTLMRHDPDARPDAARAWALVAQLDRMDPPDKAREAGHPYPAIYRRVVAATVAARAGQRGVARAELARAHRATASDPVLRLDLAYDEAYLRYVLGERAAATRLLDALLRARPMLRPLLARDPMWKRTGLLDAAR